MVRHVEEDTGQSALVEHVSPVSWHLLLTQLFGQAVCRIEVNVIFGTGISKFGVMKGVAGGRDWVGAEEGDGTVDETHALLPTSIWHPDAPWQLAKLRALQVAVWVTLTQKPASTSQPGVPVQLPKATVLQSTARTKLGTVICTIDRIKNKLTVPMRRIWLRMENRVDIAG